MIIKVQFKIPELNFCYDDDFIVYHSVDYKKKEIEVCGYEKVDVIKKFVRDKINKSLKRKGYKINGG